MIIGWIIGGFLALVSAALAAHYIWRWRRWRWFKECERRTAAKLGLGMGPDRIDATPDRPMPFGYKMAWLSVASRDSAAVARCLELVNVEQANWRTGIWAAYEGRLFATPPVRGWVLIVCFKLASLGDRNEASLISLLQSLSQQFGEAHYFGTHRVVDYHAWARYVNGAEIRAYAYLGERGQTLVDRGAKTPGEIELNYQYFDERLPLAETDGYWDREDLTYPSESHVMEVAGKWSLNPTLLDENDSEPSTGWVGDILHPHM